MAKINYDFSQDETEYSDGDIENDLLDIAKTHSDYDKIAMADGRWPVLYHFSRLRQNILNWYPFKKDSEILEIGAGCGAITGLLCEKVRHVTAVELTKRRSLINFERNKQYDNLDIYAGDIFKISFEQKFDYITLIGVLEYAAFMSKTNDPYKTLLEKAKSILKEDGHIIIAIENRFGLKYFSGAREDHTGTFFEGINGYAHTDNVKTFTKSELESLLCACDLNRYRFYYPLPDYKFPKSIYTDETINSFNDSLNFEPLDNDRVSIFDDGKMAVQFAREGVLGTFSNSFLVDVGADDDTILLAKMCNERKSGYRLATFIEKRQNGKVAVKRPMTDKDSLHLDNMARNFACNKVVNGYPLADCKKIDGGIEFEYISGKSLAQLLSSALTDKDMGAMCQVLDQFYDHIFADTVLTDDFYTPEFVNFFGLGKYNGKLYCKNPCNIDLSFYNIIKTDGGYKCIDYEWILNFFVPVEYAFWRSLLNFDEFGRNPQLLNDILQRYDINQSMVDIFRQWDYHFISSIADIIISVFNKKNSRLRIG